MNEMQQYKKVSVTIEMEDGSSTIYEVLKTREVEVEERRIPLNEHLYSERLHHMEDLLGLRFSMKAERIDGVGQIYTKREVSAGRTKQKLQRWQFDDMLHILMLSSLAEGETRKPVELWTWMHDKFEIIKRPVVLRDAHTVYLYFGGVRDTESWAKENGKDLKDVVSVHSWRKLEGARVLIKPVGLNGEWSLLNWTHAIHQRARALVQEHEEKYGSAE